MILAVCTSSEASRPVGRGRFQLAVLCSLILELHILHTPLGVCTADHLDSALRVNFTKVRVYRG